MLKLIDKANTVAMAVVETVEMKIRFDSSTEQVDNEYKTWRMSDQME